MALPTALYTRDMTAHYSAPSNPYQKANGKWTFDVYPKGVPTEFGEFSDLASARADLDKTTELFVNFGETYAFLDGIKLPLIVNQADLAKVLEVVRTTDANDISLRESKNLQHLPSEQLLEALRILKARGEISSGELFGRD